MSAQRYRPGISHERMAAGNCPECGYPPDEHYDQGNFWDPWMQRCGLYRRGVVDRIAQYEEDVASGYAQAKAAGPEVRDRAALGLRDL